MIARPRRSALKKLFKSPHFVVGGVLTAALVLVAIFAPVVAPLDPYKQDYGAVLMPPGTKGHVLGTDFFGRDVLSRTVYGARVSLTVGVTSVALGLVVGGVLGLLAGWYRKLDRPIMMLNDVLIAFPGILLAIAIVGALGPSLTNVVIAIAFFSIPTFARITRSAVLTVRDAEFISASKALGSGDGRLIFKGLVPNILSPLIVYSSSRLATSILIAATLSFLGLGAQPPIAEWGAMINEARTYLYSARYLAVIPGIAIFISVLAFNLLGDGLRDAFDPRGS